MTRPSVEVRPPEPTGDAPRPVTARRVVAFIADTLLLSILIVGFLALLESPFSVPAAGSGALNPLPTWVRLATSLAGIAYFSLSWSILGWTPGQGILRLKVQGLRDNERLSVGQAALRWAALGGPLWILVGVAPGAAGALALAVSVIWSSVLFVSTAGGSDGRGLHDRMCSTVVRRV